MISKESKRWKKQKKAKDEITVINRRKLTTNG